MVDRVGGVRLCHITTQAALDAAGPVIRAEPFLHCCTEDQLGFVLQRHFAGCAGLLILRFDPASVLGNISWEQSEPGMAPFPHLYGGLPVAATEISSV
jgi:uncharacterized protein (DUF952 family)